MLNLLLQGARPHNAFLSTFRHLGAVGLFFLTILDSSPVPTFGGPDILVAVLVLSHRAPWYVLSIVAAAGSTIGAYLTFRLARQAGHTYLENKFGRAKVSKFLRIFEKSGSFALIASTAIPFPFPTSLVFAAAGASKYHAGRFVGIVAASRLARYSAIAFAAERYGRNFVRMILHPTQHWGLFLALAGIIIVMIAAGIFINRHLAIESTPSKPSQRYA